MRLIRIVIAISLAAAVTACGSMKASDVEQLTEAARPAYRQLFSSDAAERCKGAYTLADIRPVEEPTVRRLVSLLDDEHPFPEEDWNGHIWTFSPSECAANALDKIGEPAVARMIPLLKHPNARVRMHAAFVLGRSHDPRAARPLLAAFRDPDAQVRYNAVLWADTSNPLFFDACVRALKDRDYNVRIQASRAIGAFDHPKVIDALLENLASKNVDMQVDAALALGTRKDARILPALLAALRDDSEFVQAYSALALGDLKDPGAVEPLLALVRETPDGSPRFAFIEGLGKIGDARAYETLISCLRSPNFVTRKQAVVALVRLGDSRAAESIRPLLNDEQPAVRDSAKEALTAFGARTEP